MEITKKSLAELGSCLPEPSVQEPIMTNEPLMSTVPLTYARPDQDPPFTTTTSQTNSLPRVPIQKLDLASKQWGFYQLLCVGVDKSWSESHGREGVKRGIQELFNLPKEEKNKFWQQPGDMEGFGQAFAVSEEQKFDWADVFHLITLPKRSRKPHLVPKFPPQFRSIYI
ncbi:Non-heme dioxygenase N-terminal domain containing protein [Trema orientale]|uniref:Non-heme dioxygenase N-terminal domain containing protein n=1 Tax=Trema orientale TaxID=63057 RepID=A0A2P5EHK5_TREOI|nr:Non-heme dioxygenase N-terminal domain containing protein [Trema orientale]